MIQFGGELEIGSITMNKVRAAVEVNGGHLENVETNGGRILPYHGGRDHDERVEGRRVWKAERDGSIGTACHGLDGEGAVEVISCVLYGEAGWRHYRDVMKTLRAMGATQNRAMGSHLTMGVNHNARWARFSDARQDRMGRRMASLYHYFEDAFDALSPNSRQMVSRDVMYNGYVGRVRPGNPYSGRTAVNLSKFMLYGRVEFRQPGHTMNPKNMQGWLRLCNAVISAAMNDNHRNYEADLFSFPKTLQGLLDFLNPGVQTERWAEDRLTYLMERFTQNRDLRQAMLVRDACQRCAGNDPEYVGDSDDLHEVCPDCGNLWEAA